MQHSEAWSDLDQQLKAMQDLLRGSNIDDPNLPLALFALRFLTGKQETVKSFWPCPSLQDFQLLIRKVENDLQWDDGIFSDYLLVELNRLDINALNSLLVIVEDSTHGARLQGWLLKHTYALQWRWRSDTPREVAFLMASLPNVDGPVRVFDPSCKGGNLLMAAHETFKAQSALQGQESDATLGAWAKVRFAIGAIDNVRIQLAGRQRHMYDVRQTKHDDIFDVILSNPPFGGKITLEEHQISNYKNRLNHNRISSELAYLMLAHDHLAEGGIAAVLVPHGLLFRSGSDLNFRKALVEDGAIDAVISLPGRLHAPATSITTAIMVLRRPKPGQSDSNTLFIDASRLGAQQGQKIILDDSAVRRILEMYRQRSAESGFSAFVEKGDIVAQDFSLEPGRYIAQPQAASVDASVRREKIAVLDQHARELIDQYEALIETLT